jgi:hypothetical protein
MRKLKSGASNAGQRIFKFFARHRPFISGWSGETAPLTEIESTPGSRSSLARFPAQTLGVARRDAIR